MYTVIGGGRGKLLQKLYFQLVDVPDEKVESFCRLLTEEGFEVASDLFEGTELQSILGALHKEHQAVAEEVVAVKVTRIAVESQLSLLRERGHQPGI